MSVAFDEMTNADGSIRSAYTALARWLSNVPPDVLDFRRKEAEFIFRRIGITFAVYGDSDAQERLIPFDIIPRILTGTEWRRMSRGLEQRVKALNLYLKDIYSRREILKAGVVPEDLVYQNPAFRPEMNGQKVPHDLYVHIAGIDVVRVDSDTFYVLEDNARTPSGVSYMLEDLAGRRLHAVRLEIGQNSGDMAAGEIADIEGEAEVAAYAGDQESDEGDDERLAHAGMT